MPTIYQKPTLWRKRHNYWEHSVIKPTINACQEYEYFECTHVIIYPWWDNTSFFNFSFFLKVQLTHYTVVRYQYLLFLFYTNASLCMYSGRQLLKKNQLMFLMWSSTVLIICLTSMFGILFRYENYMFKNDCLCCSQQT